MYPSPEQADEARYQSKMIVNVVIIVFLILGFLLMLQYFHFIFLKDIPLVGDWMLDIYEKIFGAPHILIIHGDDSIGDWNQLRIDLSREVIFVSEDLDLTTVGSNGLGEMLKRYSLVIVEDARTIDKGILINLDDYVQSGGNLIWVGDAGVRGEVTYNDKLLTVQTGWDRQVVCISQTTYTTCNCSTAGANSNCKYLQDDVERTSVTFSNRLGVTYLGGNTNASGAVVRIVDAYNWAVQGLKESFQIPASDVIARVSVKSASALVANVEAGGNTLPGIVMHDTFGASGNVVYFSYPPEDTMEITKPLVEVLRY